MLTIVDANKNDKIPDTVYSGEYVKRKLMAALAPPIAVYRYGCANYCAAPIAIFWITGIFSIFYGFMGGPGRLDETCLMTVLLGVGLWIIAAIWAENTIKNTKTNPKNSNCENNKATNLFQMIKPHLDESDPLKEIKKSQ